MSDRTKFLLYNLLVGSVGFGSVIAYLFMCDIIKYQVSGLILGGLLIITCVLSIVGTLVLADGMERRMNMMELNAVLCEKRKELENIGNNV